MIKGLLFTALLAGFAASSTGCACLSGLFCHQQVLFTGGCGADCGGCDQCSGGSVSSCSSCGGAGCGSCESSCGDCGSAGCGSCFPILSGVLGWIFHPCTGCGDVYWHEFYNHPPAGCDNCDNHGHWIGPGGPYQAPYNINPYLNGVPHDAEMIAPPERPATPTPAAPPAAANRRRSAATPAMYQSKVPVRPTRPQQRRSTRTSTAGPTTTLR
ncbi:MAG: hypothetical protein WDZ59_10880 [Pirellulales bacterium]